MSGAPSSGKGPGGQLRLGPGDVVGERWRLDEFLKGGGMGRVWRATDLRLLEPVAVKLLDPAGLAAEGARERFFREAQAAARLRGPKRSGSNHRRPTSPPANSRPRRGARPAALHRVAPAPPRPPQPR